MIKAFFQMFFMLTAILIVAGGIVFGVNFLCSTIFPYPYAVLAPLVIVVLGLITYWSYQYAKYVNKYYG